MFRSIYASALGGILVAGFVFAQTTERESITVDFVSRGDILRVQHGAAQEVVMLYGETCPEIDTPVGAQAKRFTENLLKNGPVTLVERYKQPRVRYVELHLADGRVLNHALLLAGLGRVDSLTAPMDEPYRALEEQARLKGAGLWRPSDAPTPSEENALQLGESPLDRYKRINRLAGDVEFDLEYEHWRRLSDMERNSIRRSLQQREAERSARAEMYLEDAAAALDGADMEWTDLENEEVRVSAAIEDSPALENTSVDALYSEDSELVRFEARLSDARSAREIALRDYGGGSAVYFRQLEEEEISETLVAERRDSLATAEAELRERFAAERAELEKRLLAIQDSLDDLERAHRRAESEHDRALAAAAQTEDVGAGVSELDALDEAEADSYEPGFPHTQVGLWKGRGPSETPGFDVTADVWTVDYDAGDRAGLRQLKGTVRRESDDGVVAQFVDNTAAHRSFLALKEPGSYYLQIQAPEGLSWTIVVTQYRDQ